MPEVDVINSPDDVDADRVATLDLGGTLVKDGYLPATFSYINRELGMSREAERNVFRTHQGDSGDIEDYHEYANHLTLSLRNADTGKDLTDFMVYANAVQDLIDDRSIISGAGEFVDYLQEEGYHTVALSSAPRAVTVPFADDIGIDAVYRFRDYVFDSETGDFQMVYVDEDAPNGKEDIVELLEEDSEVLHVGNGGNDVGAFNKASEKIERHDWSRNDEAYEEARKVV
ncbi:MAG: HAD family hydrolase [Candidatus Nanohalobium sp.]